MKKYLIGMVIGIVITIIPIIFIFNDAISYSVFYEFVTNKYDGEINDKQMNESIYEGIVSGLGDKHSQYISTDEVEEFKQSLSTTYEGIGIMIQSSEEKPFVVISQIFDGGAASEENIRVGDQIIKVNDEKITASNAPDVSTLIKSKPEVKLELYRPSTKENITINTKGKEYQNPSVHSSIISHDGKRNGFIKIDSFASTTGSEFKSALEQVESEKIDKLVIDLRDNPGGELSQLEQVANEIVPGTKPYLITKKAGKMEHEYTSELKEKKSYPIDVLQNKNTASAAEILSAALKEINKSKIIGEQSYGKGSVQQVFDLPMSSAAMKVTIEHWYSPDDNKIDGIGVEPTKKIQDNKMYVMPLILENNLELGDKGEVVYQLNNYLHLIGYDVDVDSISYTKETKNAVKHLQEKANLKITGIVDLDTAKIVYKQADKVKYHPENDKIIAQTFK